MCDTNWYQVRREYQQYAIDDWEQGNIDKSEDGIFTYACETADSSQYVIYTAYQRELWADSWEIRNYEDDSVEMGVESVTAIQQYCVYMALKDTISDTLNELYQEEASSYVRTGLKYYQSSVAGVGVMSIPVVTIHQRMAGE